jgi:hypothetical protein
MSALVCLALLLFHTVPEQRLPSSEALYGVPTDRDAAILIARQDAVKDSQLNRSNDLARFEFLVMEEETSWRVVLVQRSHVEGGGAEYVIEKDTGRIREKCYTQ